MNPEPSHPTIVIPPASPVSSQAGRRWLQAAEDSESVDLAKPLAAPCIAISIPDVGADVDPQIQELLDQQSESNNEASADMPEPATEWTERAVPKDPTRGNPKKETPKPSQNEAIESLTNSIIDRFPLGDPTVLLFVGSEASNHVDETCAKVAAELAKRNVGRILLLDSDTESQALSKVSGVDGEPGITDIVNKSVAWESTIYGRSNTGLDFQGVGTGMFSHPEADSRIRVVISEMKQEYQFICISAGDAHGKPAQIWNDICDGSYLLVSIKNSHEKIAKSAVAEMQSSGARLLGCVVTDVS